MTVTEDDIEGFAVDHVRQLTATIETLLGDADDTAACVALAKVLARRLRKAKSQTESFNWATCLLAELLDTSG